MNQEFALSILKSGKNVFLTGSAGTGKTYVLNEYIKYLRERKVAVAITASTGIAATHIGGITIHSFSGIGIKDRLEYADLHRIKSKKHIAKGIERTDVLIIDEISMLHKNQLDMVNMVFQHVRNNSKAFGGIQIIVTGDFFQLPPVSKREETTRQKFAFMSQAWLDAKLVVCYLQEQYRQTRDSLWFILEQIRSQSIDDDSVYELLATKDYQNFENPTKLFTHNVDVDQTNITELKKLDGESHLYFAQTKGSQRLVEMLERSVLAKVKLELKEETEVMFVRNNPEKNYVNGTQAKVVGFDSDDNPIVQTKSGDEFAVLPEKWTIDDETGKSLAHFEQLPLVLAWAITVHKSQGMTLDTAEIDLSGAFEKGQGYVALSRLKSIKGLKLLGINRQALQVDDWAQKADHRFAELSVKAEDLYNQEQLDGMQQSFHQSIGALIDHKEIEDYKNKLKTKGVKKSTHEQTLILVKEGMPISDIAAKRDIHERTILIHFKVLHERYPELSFEPYKPDSKVVKKVSEAINIVRANQKPSDFTEKGDLKLSAIHNELDGKVTYDLIQLAQLFI
jgi:hypothetical protein